MRPEVKTKKGIFVGKQEPGGTLAFLGIPFAKPPVGRLRFQAPRPADDSCARYDAGSFGPIPVQTCDAKHEGLPQSEDCLTLNIFTADLVLQDKPVLVWVYGGSYIKGGASRPVYNGDLMIEENPDIILVTVNYRVGIFGSLNLSSLDPEGHYRESCNLSRLDLQAALLWIHENISAFGGNPENVTVFGHSAGSSNISAQLMMKSSRPLFNRAIMHSSFAVDVGTTSWEDSLKAADVFFELLGHPDLNTLLSLPSHRLLKAQEALLSSGFFDTERKPFSVVLDDIVIPKDGFQQLADGCASGIDAIIGTCCGEYDQQFSSLNLEEKRSFLKEQCQKKTGGLDSLIQAYRSHRPESPEDEILMDIKNDLWLRAPANLFAWAMSRHSRVYLFHTMLRKKNGVRAHHGCEYEMLFCREDPELVSKETAFAVRQTWLSFVRGSAPGNIRMPKWPPCQFPQPKTLAVAEQSWIADGIRTDDLALLFPLFAETACLN